MKEEINWDELTEEQKSFVLEYKLVHNELNVLRDKMDVLTTSTQEAIKKLEDLRKKENKLFKNGKK